MMRSVFVTVFMISALVLLSAVLSATPFADAGFKGSDRPVVVELFTSQSCSSCPPADKLLQELSEKPGVIALACHVTYWDHLHWKDTLSQEFCTNRQRLYAQARGSLRNYTPQMVVSGHEEFVGSQRGTAYKAIKKAAENPAAEIGLEYDGAVLRVTLPALGEPDSAYDLWLFGTKKEVMQKIPSGENRGRTVTYVNSAVMQLVLPLWDGAGAERSINLPYTADADGLTVIAQETGYGPVVAAGTLSF